jgi:23S rRNA pseudouridine1911/1915/1917 synthase
MNPTVIYEEAEFLVIHKPAGLIVHGEHPSVVDWLAENYPETKTVGDDTENRAGIVHRLDRDTSGVMIIPRTQEAFLFFKNLFQTKAIKKTYLALVYGAPKDMRGVIDKPIGLNAGTVKRTVHTKNAKMVKDAITNYAVIKTFEISGAKVSLLKVEPQTGRTHQIRVHMASIGCPIVGDTLYGPKKQPIQISRQFLHADSIEFPTPHGNRLTMSADMPEELALLLK